jgi:aspartyl-tRNA(Asn)/glutamyl-tRNA(Gln) amidotransferase subunit B
VRLVEEGRLSGTSAKQVFADHALSGRPVADIVADAGMEQISDVAALRAAVAEVIEQNPAAVADVRAGTAKAIGFLTGQVMKRTRGQANPAIVGELLRTALGAAEAAVRDPADGSVTTRLAGPDGPSGGAGEGTA